MKVIANPFSSDEEAAVVLCEEKITLLENFKEELSKKSNQLIMILLRDPSCVYFTIEEKAILVRQIEEVKKRVVSLEIQLLHLYRKACHIAIIPPPLCEETPAKNKKRKAATLENKEEDS